MEASTMKAFKLISCVFLALLPAGCNRDIRQSFFDDIKTLDTQNDTLENKVARLQAENTQLKQQVNALSGLDVSDKQKAMPVVEKFTLTKRTGFVDKNSDGISDTLVVYVQPFDRDDDAIKAPGQLTATLWNLELTEAPALMYTWDFPPDQLSGQWSHAFTTNYYKLTLPVEPDKFHPGKEYTLKVNFTDYISGRTFDTQKAITY